MEERRHVLLGGARLPGVGADGDGGAEAVEDGVLQVERHVEVLDHQLVPHGRDRCDAGGGPDHQVGLVRVRLRARARARAQVRVRDRDRDRATVTAAELPGLISMTSCTPSPEG